jgi:hypothetical protein
MKVTMPPASELRPLILRALDSLGGTAHRNALIRRTIELGAFTREQLAVPPPATNTGRFANHISCLISTSISGLKKRGEITNIGGGRWTRIDP